MGNLKVEKEKPARSRKSAADSVLKKNPNYEELKKKIKALAEEGVGDGKIPKIQEDLKEIAREYKLQYQLVLRAYIGSLGEEAQKEIFKKYPLEDLKKIKPPAFFPTNVLAFEGITDITEIDLEETSKIDRSQPIKSKTDYLEFLRKLTFLKRIETISYLAEKDIPLMIVGETGTSKELMAKAIHKMSKRKDKHFIEINCSAFPDNLIESELFGYEKGAHSTATNKKKGIFEIANEGTLFLDELGKTSKLFQYKLLKVIEEKEFAPLGSEKKIISNIRILASAQPSDLPSPGEGNTILGDLLYRLGYPNLMIEMPTLRERFNQIGHGNRHIIIEAATRNVLKKINEPEITISEKAMNTLFTLDYQGNYRELESILSSSIISAILDHRKEVKAEDLNLNKAVASQLNMESKPSSRTQLKEDLKNVPFKDIIDYGNNVRASIVKDKMDEIKRNRGKLRTVLLAEGLPENQYTTYLKKLNRIIEKGKVWPKNISDSNS